MEHDDDDDEQVTVDDEPREVDVIEADDVDTFESLQIVDVQIVDKGWTGTPITDDDPGPTNERSENECGLPDVCSVGASGDGVWALQQWLERFRWYKGREDGSYGPLTAQAVQKCQRSMRGDTYHGPINGDWNVATRRAACEFPWG